MGLILRLSGETVVQLFGYAVMWVNGCLDDWFDIDFFGC